MRLPRVAAVVDSSEDRPPSPLTAAAVVAGLALAGTSAAITFESTASAGAAVARALMVAVPVAVGAYAWHRRPSERFGRLLMLTGFGWFLTTLSESDNELAYSIGRVAGWAVEVSLIYLVLSFPTGRLTERVDRALVWAGVVVVGALYLPSALITEKFPSPSPFSSCDRLCPDNAFMVAGSEPAWVDGGGPAAARDADAADLRRGSGAPGRAGATCHPAPSAHAQPRPGLRDPSPRRAGRGDRRPCSQPRHLRGTDAFLARGARHPGYGRELLDRLDQGADAHRRRGG